MNKHINFKPVALANVRSRGAEQVKIFLFLLLVMMVCLGYCHNVDAAPITIGSVAAKLTNSMSNLAKLITALSYVAGFGFAGAGILKFKAHKDNPTQVPLGAPIALLFVGVALIFLPTIFGVTGETLFGTTSGVGGVKGTASFS